MSVGEWVMAVGGAFTALATLSAAVRSYIDKQTESLERQRDAAFKDRDAARQRGDALQEENAKLDRDKAVLEEQLQDVVHDYRKMLRDPDVPAPVRQRWDTDFGELRVLAQQCATPATTVR